MDQRFVRQAERARAVQGEIIKLAPDQGRPVVVFEVIDLDDSMDIEANIAALTASRLSSIGINSDINWVKLEPESGADAVLDVLTRGFPGVGAPLGQMKAADIQALVSKAFHLFDESALVFSNTTPPPSCRKQHDIIKSSPIFPGAIDDVGVVVISPSLFFFAADVLYLDAT